MCVSRLQAPWVQVSPSQQRSPVFPHSAQLLFEQRRLAPVHVSPAQHV
jgi:hypothetical protein